MKDRNLEPLVYILATFITCAVISLQIVKSVERDADDRISEAEQQAYDSGYSDGLYDGSSDGFESRHQHQKQKTRNPLRLRVFPYESKSKLASSYPHYAPAGKSKGCICVRLCCICVRFR